MPDFDLRFLSMVNKNGDLEHYLYLLDFRLFDSIYAMLLPIDYFLCGKPQEFVIYKWKSDKKGEKALLEITNQEELDFVLGEAETAALKANNYIQESIEKCMRIVKNGGEGALLQEIKRYYLRKKGKNFEYEMWKESLKHVLLPQQLGDFETQNMYEGLGFKFEFTVNEIFMSAKLPSGWKKTINEEPGYINIVDRQGRIRIKEYFEVTPEDCIGFMWLLPRYNVVTRILTEVNNNLVETVFEDHDGTVIYTTGIIELNSEAESQNKIEPEISQLEANVHRWASENYPSYKSPLAYWNANTKR